jgi:hypothetical protein
MDINSVESREFFTIQNCPRFKTGTSGADAAQVLMGLYSPDLVCVFFDGGGELVRVESRPADVPPSAGYPYIYDIYQPAFRARLAGLIESWQREIGYVASPIRIHPFKLQDRFIGVAERPEFYEEFLLNPEHAAPNEARRARMHELVRKWDREGMFVLYWAKDFWMTNDGQIHST